MKFVRYNKNNCSINIGTCQNKVSFFFNSGLHGCLTWGGKRIFHFGKW